MAHCGDSETQTYGKRDDLQATVGFTMETKPNRRCKEDMKTRKKKSKQTQNFFCFVFILFSLLTFCTFFFFFTNSWTSSTSANDYLLSYAVY